VVGEIRAGWFVMLTLILRRLMTAVPTLLAVILFSFLLMRFAPGGPFDGERPLDPATREALMATSPTSHRVISDRASSTAISL
jgi:ABC-type microcin C transport system permease subunit YejB